MKITGYINIFKYKTGQIRSGTGFYSTRRAAELVGNHKSNYIATLAIQRFESKDKFKLENGGFTEYTGEEEVKFDIRTAENTEFPFDSNSSYA